MEDTIATKSEYFQRQNKLISRVLPDSLIVIPNNRPSIRSNDTKYPYRANSYMLYLSDWQEPNSVLTISNLNGERESTLTVATCTPTVLPVATRQGIRAHMKIGKRKK